MPLPIPAIASTCLGSLIKSDNLLMLGFNGFGGVAVGTDAEGIAAVDFEQIGSFVQDASDGFIVHA